MRSAYFQTGQGQHELHDWCVLLEAERKQVPARHPKKSERQDHVELQVLEEVLEISKTSAITTQRLEAVGEKLLGLNQNTDIWRFLASAGTHMRNNSIPEATVDLYNDASGKPTQKTLNRLKVETAPIKRMVHFGWNTSSKSTWEEYLPTLNAPAPYDSSTTPSSSSASV